MNRLAGAQTGLYFVTHGNAGHRFSYRRAGSAASRMGPASVPPGLVESARWLHCSGISQAISTSACDAVFEAIARARAAGTRVSYDLNFRASLWPAAAGYYFFHCKTSITGGTERTRGHGRRQS